MQVRITLLALTMLGAACMPAQASLLGRAMSGYYGYPNVAMAYPDAMFAPAAFVISTGQETSVDVEHVTNLLIDFDNDDLTITFDTVLASPTWNNTAFNGLVFTSALPTNINGAWVAPATTLAGFDDSRVWFTDDQIFIDWHGLSYADGTQLIIDFAVPEPASALLLAPLLLLACRTKRKAA